MPETTMRAIQTRYHGCHFRSRLEARWAVFFDSLGVPWEYEPQGFEFPYPGGTTADRYLPDFWLPRQEVWIEIKGVYPTETEQDLLRLVVASTEHDGFIFFGTMPFANGQTLERDSDSAIAITYAGGPEQGSEAMTSWDHAHAWCECPKCRSVGVTFDGRCGRLPCRDTGCDDITQVYNACSPRLAAAYEDARSARFGR